MDACGGSGGSLENEGGDDVVRGCNDTIDEEAHVATAVIFEGVPNFEIISGSGTTSRVNNEGTERETLSVRCTSLGNDGEMIVNTIEVTTDELRSMGQLNSEEVELVYSPNNVQFQVAAVEGNSSNNVGNELELGSIEELETFSRIAGVGETSTALPNHEPRLVIQQGFNAEEGVPVPGTGLQIGNTNASIFQNEVTLTIDGQRISFNSCRGPEPEPIIVTQAPYSKSTLENLEANDIILTNDIQGLEQQIPVIVKTATLAQQTVTAELASYSNVDPENRDGTTDVSTIPFSQSQSTATLQVEVSEGNVIELKKIYCQPGLCRVCLLPRDNLTSIFEDVNFDANGLIENARGPNTAKFHLYAAIKAILDIEVEYNDGLPTGICIDCYDNLMNFSTFRKQIAIGQAKLNQILEQVKDSNTPTFIPSLGEADLQNVGIYKNSSCIVKANELAKTSQYSHLVVRNLSDRIWDKIFTSMSQIVGFKSGKLKSLERFVCEVPYVTGYFCYTCNSTIHGTKDDFVEHHNHFHGVSSHQDVHFPCDICGNSYPLVDSSTGELESYAEHWLQHFFMHECDFCKKKLPSSKGLWVHKKSLHSRKDKIFVCDEDGCEKCFSKKSQLDAHKASHPTNEESRLEHICNECNKCFSNASSLIMHTASVHGTKRRWKCDVVDCLKEFKRKETLIAHKNTVHLNLRKFECEICGDTFKSQSSKTVHILRHKGEKPHICTVCSKDFYVLNALKSHMVKHKDSGDFQCDLCSKIFKRASYLKEHKRTHTGEKPFTCNVCHRDFRMKSNYFKHMKIHRRKNEIP